MNEPDTARILSRDSLAGTEDGSPAADDCDGPGEKRTAATTTTTTTTTCCGCRVPRCPVTVEPVMFLAMFSLILQGPLSTQYLFDRMSQEVGFNRSRTSECGGGNGSLPPDPLQKEVEALAAHWNLYINLAGFAVGMLMVPLLGSWSDVAGRRVILIIPSVGMALQAAVYLLVMYLELPVAYFLLGRIASGLSGDFSVVLAGCFSYVADISDRATRTFRVAILEACLGVAGMLASIIGGHWKQAQGYIKPFWLVLATNLTSALYVYFFLRETVPPDTTAKFPALRHYKAVWRLLSTGGATAGEEGRRLHRSKLWLYLLCFFVVVTVHSGSVSLYVLYELSSPLCWGPTLIGFGSAVFHLGYLSSLLGLKLMQRCLADSWVALIGLLSNIIGLVVVSVSDNTQLMFTGYGLNFLFMTTTPVIRSKLSKLVDSSQQGALFAAVACVESLCFLVGTSLCNALYPATLHWMKGFPFLFGALLQLIPAGIMGVLQCLDSRRDR